MKPIRQRKFPTGPRGQHGFVLVVGMIFLAVMLLLSVSLFRSGGMQERMAGNTREKQRAMEAAQSALRYGEWWLGQANRGTGSSCNAVTNANVQSQMQVCSNAIATPASLPWAARADYLPPAMTVSTSGGVNANGDINYQSKPGLYISYLGLTPAGTAELYQVTAFGYGGGASTAAVVRSVYQMATSTKDLGGP
jgi:type IV pilus assembly protein PilX